MTKNSAADVMTKVVDLLIPLPSEERVRVIKAAMVLLGEEVPPPSRKAAETPDEDVGGTLNALPHRARAWMKQNSISEAELQQVFHMSDEGAEVIAAHIPGKNKKGQTYNAYVLTGIGQLLATGTPSFQDKLARGLCERSGCYDNANHSVHLKNKGNEFTGTKDKGWTLTAPGLKRAADLIKELNSQ
jgi:hypothetical protein